MLVGTLNQEICINRKVRVVYCRTSVGCISLG